MDLNDLLNGKGINPESVLVFRHRPAEPRLCKALPWLAAEKPDVFNAYQQTQGEKVEKAMTSASYVASFIGSVPRSGIGLNELSDHSLSILDALLQTLL
jgi:hypothetical protein